MIPKRDKTTDIATEVAQGQNFRKKLMTLVDEVTNRFMNGEGLNTVIAEVSQRESFNRVQIQRLIEETNTIAYNKKYTTVKKEKDRRISFELAELSQVIDLMGEQAPKEMENPNWVKGRPGGGEMDKSASIESSYIHNPNRQLDLKRERLLEKQASFQHAETTKKLERTKREFESSIFKIANSLVMTEKLYKKANQTFNTLLDDVELDEETIGMIQKKAFMISQHLVETKRIRPDFMVSLEVKPTEKIASVVLGDYSLLKKASDDVKVEVPKVAITADVANYQQLINLAKAIKNQQVDLQADIN